jgi:hypothetical protein
VREARPGASCRRQGRQPRRRSRRLENHHGCSRRADSEANVVDPPCYTADDFQAFCNFSRRTPLHESGQRPIAEFGSDYELFRRWGLSVSTQGQGMRSFRIFPCRRASIIVVSARLSARFRDDGRLASHERIDGLGSRYRTGSRGSCHTEAGCCEPDRTHQRWRDEQSSNATNQVERRVRSLRQQAAAQGERSAQAVSVFTEKHPLVALMIAVGIGYVGARVLRRADSMTDRQDCSC